ncbi:hypothetical protein [Nocardioides sp. 1609]|uniref:hypothetical protein n=1 Tax=Nocardioides sp. 1609 TaxID=2508327 RepID=UPI00106FF0C4|nr:hypothetical protein [Nocardioides sp. 1609]
MSLIPTRPRARLSAAALVVGSVLVLVSPVLGRADVNGSYRPVLPPDGLTTGCFPLPGGVVPDFAYVLRRDGDTLAADGLRRRTVLQLDRIDAGEAKARLEAQFGEAGVRDVRIEARDFEGVPDDAVVRGEMVLDLPVVTRQSDDPDCFDLNSTKRFTPDLADRS